jgi:hypothetical protein
MTARVSLVSLALVVLALGGCATSVPYGNFVPPPAALDQPALAAQAARQLAALWPPARTRFALTQPTPDAFGAALIGQLRAAGYAVQEAGPRKASGADTATHEAGTQQGAPAEPGRAAGLGGEPSTAALPLRYVLDHDAGTGLYRLTLWVGTQSLTRAYRAQDRTLIAAGAWVRKQ